MDPFFGSRLQGTFGSFTAAIRGGSIPLIVLFSTETDHAYSGNTGSTDAPT